MAKEPSNIIDELEFVLTHPSCNASVLEKFYNNWLFMLDTVPLFAIVDHMKKHKPGLLSEWSKINNTVLSLLNEMEPDSKVNPGSGAQIISIQIDISGLQPTRNGVYQVLWESELEEPIVNAHFKTKSLSVIDKHFGILYLVGFSHLDVNRYHLYVKIGRKA
ncbi:hypothetical protein [Paenibacillus ihuae]|uniref:hypothetical protein n=1 Tax=Paenibacillus ihuae TaxID=1232431 RepID=UPI0006D52FFC|nr:hypothetical protein [Paenibacillus ihuae]